LLLLVEESGGQAMNEDTLKGEWTQLKGCVRRQWGMLTNDDMAAIKGEREVLLGKLQERYGHTREEVERELDDWFAKPRS
jgi:uncharacterized protein YjbJ (UPF0337 family)